jgi:uncharacterized membrane protein
VWLSIPEFIGHLHPVLVHLPIGILLLACLFLWQSRKNRYVHWEKTIGIILLLGMLSAIASCITGLVLAQTGDYELSLVSLHQWLGISVAAVSALAYFSWQKAAMRKWQWLIATLLLVLVFITGHLGGSLTHGPDYLTAPLISMDQTEEKEDVRKPISNVQEAFVYADIIQPLFHRRCETCHGPHRQKGKLRLDQPNYILQGGKDGMVIKPGNADSSLLVKRILLPLDDEHHMAPKEKKQLSRTEIQLIRWWVENGADFVRKVKDLPQPAAVKPLLQSLQESPQEEIQADLPEASVESPPEAVLDSLRKSGVVVMPIAQNSHYYQADFLNAGISGDSLLLRLLPLKKQLVWLRLSYLPVRDSALAAVGQCVQLRNLLLDHTKITGAGLALLDSLQELRSLNLTGTRVSANGVALLRGLRKLQTVYLFQTLVATGDWPSLIREFPKTRLDSGGYAVPFLPTDTQIVKPPRRQDP